VVSDVTALFEQTVTDLNDRLRAISDDLLDTGQYIRARFMPTPQAGGWGQFLQGDIAPTVTGTACIVSSLGRMGVSRREPQLAAAASFLCAEQEADGGWSKPSFSGQMSLTLVTCLCLQALETVGITTGHAVADGGTQWLRNAQNSDGGWGYTPADEQSDVTSTAYALRALCLDGAGGQFKEAMESGAAWIVQQQNGDGGWGMRLGEASTLAHTAHAAEGLLVAGESGLVGDARRWLLARVPGDSLSPWDEHYQVLPNAKALPSVEGRGRGRLRWTHLPTQRSIIALLKLGVDPSDAIVSALVDDLSARHEKGSCWRVQTIPDVTASWAILESVNALTAYQDAMESVKQVVAFREVIRLITPRVQALEAENADISEKLEALTATVVTLSRRKRPVQAIRNFVLAPETHLAAVVIAGATLLVLYLSIWSRGSDAGARVIGAATIAAPALALLEMVRRRRKRTL
jgi:hypothetical protein